jgi:hypothetical protein
VICFWCKDEAVFFHYPEKDGAFMVKNITPHSAKHMPGETVYERYLRTEELLSLQKPESELAHHDELQFQIVHQVFELWWKETAFELNSIRSLLQEYNVPLALRLLQRVIQIQHLMMSNLRMLETMSPWDFTASAKCSMMALEQTLLAFMH